MHNLFVLFPSFFILFSFYFHFVAATPKGRGYLVEHIFKVYFEEEKEKKHSNHTYLFIVHLL